MSNKHCTPQEEKFVNYLLQGMKTKGALQKAYPHTINWKDNSLHTLASKIRKRPHVSRRYDELLLEFQEREKEKTGWTREQSVTTLRYVIDKNMEEVDRIGLAYEDELIHLAELIRQNPEQAELITRDMLAKRKQRRLSTVNNQGITQAVGELNKMHGYNEHNINVTEQVLFEGEDELED